MSQLNSVIRLVTLCLGTALFAFCLGIIGTAASLQGQEWMLYSPGYFKRWIIWLIVCASCHLPISIFGCFSTLKHSQNEEEDRTPSRIKLILSQTLLFLPLVAFAAVGADLRATARSLRAGAALAYGAADGAYEPALVYDRFESAFRAELHARYFAATCGDDEDGFSWSFLNNDVKCEDTMVGSLACQQTCGNCSSETFDNRGEAGCCPAAGPCAAGDARGCPFDRCRAALGDFLGGAVGPLGALALASTGLGLAHLLGLGALACYYPADDLERQLVKAGTIKKPPAQAKKKGGSKAASAAGTTGGSPSTAAASASPPGGNPQGRLGAEAAAAAEDRQGGGVCRDLARPPALQLSRQNSSWRSARDLSSRSARDLSSAGRRVPSSRRRVLGTDEEEERFVLNEDGTGVVRISTGRRLAPQEVNPHMENIERINEVLGNFTARVEQRLATSLVDGIRHLRVHRPFTPAHHHPHPPPPGGGAQKRAEPRRHSGLLLAEEPANAPEREGSLLQRRGQKPNPPGGGGSLANAQPQPAQQQPAADVLFLTPRGGDGRRQRQRRQGGRGCGGVSPPAAGRPVVAPAHHQQPAPDGVLAELLLPPRGQSSVRRRGGQWDIALAPAAGGAVAPAEQQFPPQGWPGPLLHEPFFRHSCPWGEKGGGA